MTNLWRPCHTLQTTPEALPGGIVVAVTSPWHRCLHLKLFHHPTVVAGAILVASIGMVNQSRHWPFVLRRQLCRWTGTGGCWCFQQFSYRHPPCQRSFENPHFFRGLFLFESLLQHHLHCVRTERRCSLVWILTNTAWPLSLDASKNEEITVRILSRPHASIGVNWLSLNYFQIYQNSANPIASRYPRWPTPLLTTKTVTRSEVSGVSEVADMGQVVHTKLLIADWAP